MVTKFEMARTKDAPAISALRCAVAEHLTAKYGRGHWSGNCTERGVLFDMRNARVYVMRREKEIVGTLTLATKKPWAIDRKYFTDCERPIYLTSMAVSPELQRQGIGRLCVAGAVEVVKLWPGDAIFLDAYDAEAGAGEFYRKCGFREVGRVTYREVPLIYYELIV